jgi:hypothetical protein
MIRFLTIAALILTSINVHAAKEGDSMAIWLKDPAFKKLYSQALANSPANHKNSWVYKDAQLALSVAIPGQNANTWIRVATCASQQKNQCRLNHIEVFYDAVNQELFAFLTMGSRVGWIGGVRGPTSLEQKFLTPLLTARDIR